MSLRDQVAPTPWHGIPGGTMTTRKPRLIRVPETPRPKTYKDRCWQRQPDGMGRCIFTRGHKGKHGWDRGDAQG